MVEAVPAAAPAAAPQKLDELMLAMDVVDTLRHQEGLAETALAEDERDAALKERLRKIYEGQGLAVTDRILDDGIRALKESRFTYDPAPASFRRTLALFWIERAMVGKVLAAALVTLIGLGAFTYWRIGYTERLAETARIEMTVTLPNRLDVAAKAAEAVAVSSDAKAEVDRLVADAGEAITEGNRAKVNAAIAAVDALRQQLEQTYALKLVTRPGERTGVFRIPDVNKSARVYYLIVEAVAPDGSKLSLPIVSETTGTTTTVAKWGVRVPKATYDAVARDKQDDGIVENDVVGRKLRGYLTPTYDMAVENGAITAW